MRFQIFSGALSLAGSVAAFSDSSPWVLLSTSSLGDSPNYNQIQTSSQVLDYTKLFLQTCPTDRYLVVNQPGVTTADLRGSKGCAMPGLCSAAEDSRVKGKFVVSEIVGDVTDSRIADYIKAACGRDGKEVTVDELNLASYSSDDRAGALSENNALLSDKVDSVTTDGSYTILFLSTPGEPTYEADFAEPLRMDLKRHVQSVRRQDGDADWDNLPLFEKYQFFTPGIFMGIIVALLLLSILGVGLKALSSLEVSYGAFDKEMGPAAQKKQQ